MINVRVDDSQLRAALRDAKDQIPFALATALNATAMDAWAEVRRRIEVDMGVRRPKWTLGTTPAPGRPPTQGSIRVGFAKKAHPVAEVRVIDEIMAKLLDSGGDRPKGKRGEEGWVPAGEIAGKARREVKRVMGPATWPARIAGKVDKATGAKTRFYRETDKGVAVIERYGKPEMVQKQSLDPAKRGSGKTRPRYPIRIVWWRPKDPADLPRVFDLHRVVDTVVAKKWEANCAAAVAKALATRR